MIVPERLFCFILKLFLSKYLFHVSVDISSYPEYTYALIDHLTHVKIAHWDR